MPLKIEKDGTCSWKPTSKADVKTFRKELSKTQEGLRLTYDLKRQIDKKIQNTNPIYNVHDLAESNYKLYNTVTNLVNSTTGLVDIILPVYNAIHLVEECIRCVRERTHWPYHLIIVDDASDAHTANCLGDIAQRYPNITVLHNKKNRGFAASVNRGINYGNGQYICLLNSDVFVTRRWLTKMMMAIQADPKHKIVCPTTNNTAIVEVPLSPGASYMQMNKVFETFSRRRYPEIMATGFCMLYPRSLIHEIGPIDPSYVSYGEDSDFWYRTIRHHENGTYKNYKAVLADDTYVFHQRSMSFSQLGDEAHNALRRLASGRFNRLWPEWTDWRKSHNVDRSMKLLRLPIPADLLNETTDPYRICWVAHSAQYCGAIGYIADVINRLIEKGVNAKIAIIKREEDSKEHYAGVFRTAPIFFNNSEEFMQEFSTQVFPQGIVVASTVELVPQTAAVAEFSGGKIRPLLHAQSYELAMADDENVRASLKNLYALIPDCISNSKWVSKELEAEVGVKPFMTVCPGVDTQLFYRRRRTEDDRKVIMVCLRNELKCREWQRGIELIFEVERLAKEQGTEIQVLVIGADNLPTHHEARCLGEVSHARLSTLLGSDVDVFVDPSSYHSYGLPAVEAAASGVKVFSWENRGIREWSRPTDATVFDADLPVTEAATEIIEYVSDSKLQEQHEREWHSTRLAIETHHNRAKSVETFISGIEDHFKLLRPARSIAMVVPHLRKHGGPTTMLAIANQLAARGHEVIVYTVYPDINDEVVAMTDLPIRIDTQKIEPCDIILTNSDNPLTAAIAKLEGPKKIMIKLSHNARFKAAEELGLQQKWDAIVTSSEWLREVCEKPTEGWNYPASRAHRVGWWHYGHPTFKVEATERGYGGTSYAPVVATLIHSHPSKGTRDAIATLGYLYSKYQDGVQLVGIGEVPPQAFKCEIPNLQYIHAPNRTQMAETLRQVDIWLGASHTEGLGRMGLEAMSSRCAVVLSDTGAEYVRPGVNCLTFPVGDSKAAFEQIDRLLGAPEARIQMSEQGYRTAEAMADPADCMDNLSNIIEEVFHD